MRVVLKLNPASQHKLSRLISLVHPKEVADLHMLPLDVIKLESCIRISSSGNCSTVVSWCVIVEFNSTLELWESAYAVKFVLKYRDGIYQYDETTTSGHSVTYCIVREVIPCCVYRPEPSIYQSLDLIISQHHIFSVEESLPLPLYEIRRRRQHNGILIYHVKYGGKDAPPVEVSHSRDPRIDIDQWSSSYWNADLFCRTSCWTLRPGRLGNPIPL